MNKQTWRSIGIGFLLLLLGWQVGFGMAQHQYAQKLGGIDHIPTGSGQMVQDPEKEVDISLLWRVWRLLNDNYIEPQKLLSTPLMYGAVEGMVRAVGDPYTVFMTPKNSTAFHDSLSGKLQGIGAELEMREGLVTVVNTLKGSPALRAGLLPNDVITDVDGKTVEGKTLDEVVSTIRGPKGTSVTLKLVRPKPPKQLSLTIGREDIHVPSVESKIIQSAKGPIGYIALNQFGEGSIDELKQELLTLKPETLKGLILDLRFNGGGYLDGAVDLVSLFQKDGRVVSVQHRQGAPEIHDVTGAPLYPTLPLVILQNEGSASASEITSGALQDHKRATIVGTKSYGKGTVQEVMDLPGGSSLRVTVAHWLTPNGKDLGKEGVHPDITVERTVEDMQAGKDSQLDAAVTWLAEGKKPVAAASSSSHSSSTVPR